MSYLYSRQTFRGETAKGRIFRKFADSWNGSGEAENAPLLTKQIDTLSTVELLFNISKLAEDPRYGLEDCFLSSHWVYF
jgi:hypothetical protein